MLAEHCRLCCCIPAVPTREDSIFVATHALTVSQLRDDFVNGRYTSDQEQPLTSSPAESVRVDFDDALMLVHGELPDSGFLESAASGERAFKHVSAGPSQCRPISSKLICQSLPLEFDSLSDEDLQDCGSDIEKQDSNTDECVICLESLADEESNIVSLPCGHMLHEACLWNLHKCAANIQGQTAKCPLCRLPLTGDADEVAAVLQDESASNDDSVKAALALGKMGYAAAAYADSLVPHSRGNHVGLRSAAVWSLGQMGEAVLIRHAPALVERLGDDEPGIREEAQRIFQAAGEVGARVLTDALMDTLNGEVIWQAARESLEAMGMTASRALAAALTRKEGRGTGPAAKYRAITTLAHLGGKAGACGTRALVTLLSGNAFPSVRHGAAMALGSVCKSQFEGQALGIAALAAALADHDEGVRQSAASSMAKLGRSASPHITAMLHVLRHRQPHTQRHVLEALGKMGELCFAGKSVEEQLDESSAIFTIPCQIALARLLNDTHTDVKWATLEALRRMGVTGAIVLASQLNKKNAEGDVSVMCRQGLQQMGQLGNMALASQFDVNPQFRSVTSGDRAAETKHNPEDAFPFFHTPSQIGCAQSLASKIEVLIHAETRSEQRTYKRPLSAPACR